MIGESSNNRNILTFDLGGSSMKSAIVDESFHIQRRRKYILDGISVESKRDEKDIVLEGIRDADSFADTIVEIKDQAEKETEIVIEGIAFSYNCPADHLTGDTFSGGVAQRFLNNLNFADLFRNRCDIPVSVAKDSNCMLLAEAEAGCLKGRKNALAIGLGSGIACGILINGEVYMGHHCMAGEVSNLLESKKQCTDVLAGDTGMWGLLTRMGRAVNQKPEELNGYLAFQLIEEGTARTVRAYRDYVRAVAVMLTNFKLTFGPEAIALGGGIASQKRLIEDVRLELLQIEKEFPPAGMLHTELLQCRYEADANLIGAGIALKKYMEHQNA